MSKVGFEQCLLVVGKSVGRRGGGLPDLWGFLLAATNIPRGHRPWPISCLVAPYLTPV